MYHILLYFFILLFTFFFLWLYNNISSRVSSIAQISCIYRGVCLPLLSHILFHFNSTYTNTHSQWHLLSEVVYPIILSDSANSLTNLVTLLWGLPAESSFSSTLAVSANEHWRLWYGTQIQETIVSSVCNIIQLIKIKRLCTLPQLAIEFVTIMVIILWTLLW